MFFLSFHNNIHSQSYITTPPLCVFNFLPFNFLQQPTTAAHHKQLQCLFLNTIKSCTLHNKHRQLLLIVSTLWTISTIVQGRYKDVKLLTIVALCDVMWLRIVEICHTDKTNNLLCDSFHSSHNHSPPILDAQDII